MISSEIKRVKLLKLFSSYVTSIFHIVLCISSDISLENNFVVDQSIHDRYVYRLFVCTSILYTALIWSAKILLYSTAGGYLCQAFKHLNKEYKAGYLF